MFSQTAALRWPLSSCSALEITGHSQPHLKNNIRLDVILFWLSVQTQTVNISDISDQRILQYDCLRGFPAITSDFSLT